MNSFLSLAFAAGIFVSTLTKSATAAPTVIEGTCRSIPGDAGWPKRGEWSRLNDTVGGQLIETIAQASVCHTSPYKVNHDECEALRRVWDFEIAPPYGTPYYVTRMNLTVTMWDMAPTFVKKPAEIANPYFQNQTCDPFTPESKPCELGNLASYSINVTSANDVIAGVKFAYENNIRLSIKNTGHDYMGKSSGQGSLSLWTFNLKQSELISHYKSPSYSGPAMKWGAGVGVGFAMQEASKVGYTVVGGECGTVGLAGGYSQGGGHSILNSAYGLAADQVLEWEVVTGEGKHLIATPLENSDIYWALSGGGGGTYGVVVSMTGKLHPEMKVAGASLTFYKKGVPEDVYWEAVGLWYKHLPEYVVGTNNTIQFVIWEDNLAAQSLNLLDQHSSAFGPMLGPFLEELDDRGIKYVLTITDSDTYFEHFNKYYGPLPYGIEPPTTILNSRIVPKSVVLDPEANAKLVDAVRLTVKTGEFLMGCSALDLNVDHAENAVLPAWRDSIGVCIMNAFWNWTAPFEDNMEVKKRMVEVYAPAMEDATPGSGVYLNEMDPLYKGDWKQSMYGPNYDRLLEVKHKYDPHSLFYGHFAVGSDEFTVDGAGRLCHPRAQSFNENQQSVLREDL